MNLAALQAWAGQNKVALLGAGAAGAVLLGLRTRSKATGGGPRTAQPAGTLPAAAVVPANGLQATGSTYDSSAFDVYSALMPQLEALRQTGTSSGVTDVPPIAQSIFAPNWTGKYVKYTNGTIGEIESDGSVYGISGAEAAAKGVNVPGMQVTALPWQNHLAGGPSYGDAVHNLAAAGGNPIKDA